MFGEEEFKDALLAYEMETSPTGNDEFTHLRKQNTFFEDIRTEESFREQIRLFVQHISGMDRDDYKNRYVLQTFLLEFCRYLDKDFLFTITEGKTFFSLKKRLKEFTGSIYETHKRFTQAIALHSLEHLLEDYGNLLRFLQEEEEETLESRAGEGGEGTGFWAGNKLW
jgi:hypothetical protein